MRRCSGSRVRVHVKGWCAKSPSWWRSVPADRPRLLLVFPSRFVKDVRGRLHEFYCLEVFVLRAAMWMRVGVSTGCVGLGSGSKILMAHQPATAAGEGRQRRSSSRRDRNCFVCGMEFSHETYDDEIAAHVERCLLRHNILSESPR